MSSSSEPQPEENAQHTGFLTPRVVRMLVISIIVMTALIIAGVVAVFIGIKTKLEARQMEPPVTLEIGLDMKSGEQLRAYKRTDEGVWLEFASGNATRLVHIMDTGHISEDIRLTAPE